MPVNNVALPLPDDELILRQVVVVIALLVPDPKMHVREEAPTAFTTRLASGEQILAD